MSKQHVDIIKPELSINQKLGQAKFNEVFDQKTLSEAEKAVKESERIFREETLKDFASLKAMFARLSPQQLKKEDCQKLCELAFSIKSRAATGGLPLASEIATSMYEFCDCDAAGLMDSQECYRIIKEHFAALTQVFENNSDTAGGKKLLKNLQKITKKYISDGKNPG